MSSLEGAFVADGSDFSPAKLYNRAAFAVNDKSEVVKLMKRSSLNQYIESQKHLKNFSLMGSVAPTAAKVRVKPQTVRPNETTRSLKTQYTANEKRNTSIGKDQDGTESAHPTAMMQAKLQHTNSLEQDIPSEHLKSHDTDAYFDMIPDEPINREVCAQRSQIVENYSYDKFTGTIPAQRVKLESSAKKIPVATMGRPGKRKRMKSAVQNSKKGLFKKMALFEPKVIPLSSPTNDTAYGKKKTPIMAQRYFMRQDLVNKKVLASKSQRVKSQQKELITQMAKAAKQRYIQDKEREEKEAGRGKALPPASKAATFFGGSRQKKSQGPLLLSQQSERFEAATTEIKPITEESKSQVKFSADELESRKKMMRYLESLQKDFRTQDNSVVGDHSPRRSKQVQLSKYEISFEQDGQKLIQSQNQLGSKADFDMKKKSMFSHFKEESELSPYREGETLVKNSNASQARIQNPILLGSSGIVSKADPAEQKDEASAKRVNIIAIDPARESSKSATAAFRNKRASMKSTGFALGNNTAGISSVQEDLTLENSKSVSISKISRIDNHSDRQGRHQRSKDSRNNSVSPIEERLTKIREFKGGVEANLLDPQSFEFSKRHQSAQFEFQHSNTHHEEEIIVSQVDVEIREVRRRDQSAPGERPGSSQENSIASTQMLRRNTMQQPLYRLHNSRFQKPEHVNMPMIITQMGRSHPVSSPQPGSTVTTNQPPQLKVQNSIPQITFSKEKPLKKIQQIPEPQSEKQSVRNVAVSASMTFNQSGNQSLTDSRAFPNHQQLALRKSKEHDLLASDHKRSRGILRESKMMSSNLEMNSPSKFGIISKDPSEQDALQNSSAAPSKTKLGSTLRKLKSINGDIKIQEHADDSQVNLEQSPVAITKASLHLQKAVQAAPPPMPMDDHMSPQYTMDEQNPRVIQFSQVDDQILLQQKERENSEEKEVPLSKWKNYQEKNSTKPTVYNNMHSMTALAAGGANREMTIFSKRSFSPKEVPTALNPSVKEGAVRSLANSQSLSPMFVIKPHAQLNPSSHQNSLHRNKSGGDLVGQRNQRSAGQTQVNLVNIGQPTSNDLKQSSILVRKSQRAARKGSPSNPSNFHSQVIGPLNTNHLTKRSGDFNFQHVGSQSSTKQQLQKAVLYQQERNPILQETQTRLRPKSSLTQHSNNQPQAPEHSTDASMLKRSHNQHSSIIPFDTGYGAQVDFGLQPPDSKMTSLQSRSANKAKQVRMKQTLEPNPIQEGTRSALPINQDLTNLVSQSISGGIIIKQQEHLLQMKSSKEEKQFSQGLTHQRVTDTISEQSAGFYNSHRKLKRSNFKSQRHVSKAMKSTHNYYGSNQTLRSAVSRPQNFEEYVLQNNLSADLFKDVNHDSLPVQRGSRAGHTMHSKNDYLTYAAGSHEYATSKKKNSLRTWGQVRPQTTGGYLPHKEIMPASERATTSQTRQTTTATIIGGKKFSKNQKIQNIQLSEALVGRTAIVHKQPQIVRPQTESRGHFSNVIILAKHEGNRPRMAQQLSKTFSRQGK